MINEIDDGTASIDSDTFCTLVLDIYKDIDQETLFKDTFRVFSKDDEGMFSDVWNDRFYKMKILQVVFQQMN